MQIFFRFYRFLIVCSVLRFHTGFLKFFFRGLVLMDCVACLKHLFLDYELGCGFFMFGFFKQVSKFLGLFLLFGIGMKFLYFDRFVRVLIRFLCDLRGVLKNGFCSKNVLDRKKFVMLKFLPLADKLDERKRPDTDFVEKLLTSDSVDEFNADHNEDADENEYIEEIDSESDVSNLRKLLKIERHKNNVALAELAKERAASASAAEEAMAMILRLQNEKSLIEMESNQYKRLSEEKQIHDQEVIRSLQWLVWRHESERSLLEDQLKLYRKKWKRCSEDEFEEDGEDAESSFNGSILDALENVLYSSRDANFLVSH